MKTPPKPTARTQRKAKVTPEHLAEAARLRAIWERASHKPSQAVFGELYEVGTQPAVGSFLNGKTPLSLKAAKGFSIGLNCSIGDFSPRLEKLTEGLSRSAIQETTNVSDGVRIHAKSFDEKTLRIAQAISILSKDRRDALAVLLGINL